MNVLSKALFTSVLLLNTNVIFASDNNKGDNTGASNVQIDNVKVSVVGTWSMLSQYKQFERPFWSETITENSDGAVIADVKGFNEMGLKGSEVVRLMKSGVIDFGSTVLGYLAADNPKNEAIDLAGLSPNIETAKIVSDAYKTELSELYNKTYDIKLLGLWPYSAQVLFCNTPITGLSDLKGKKIRTSNRTLAEFVGALGGVGVTMSFGEVVQSLQKGVVDCAITGSMSGYSAKWHEVTTHLYTLPLGWANVMHAVSNKAWNKLPKATQDYIEQEISGLESNIWKGAALETEQGIACNTGYGKCQSGEPANLILVEYTERESKLLDNILSDHVLPLWAERCGKPCVNKWNETIGKAIGKEINNK
jgi:TRAP-type C4-dicarboxylate transport system substrate-binding protein